MTVIENIKVAFQSRMYYSMLDGMLRNTYYDRGRTGAAISGPGRCFGCLKWRT